MCHILFVSLRLSGKRISIQESLLTHCGLPVYFLARITDCGERHLSTFPRYLVIPAGVKLLAGRALFRHGSRTSGISTRA